MIIKICGIQNEDTLLCCERNRVNFFGMIFYKESPRNISFENASMLQNISQDLNINGVGVFVNKNIIELEQIIKNLNLRFVQLHGSEDDLNKIDKYESVDYFLFDYKPLKGELPGGNSKSFDWNILKNLETKKPWFLSGGINTDNIKQILKDINPLGIDLSSGVEKELGIKDNHIINNFIGKLKNA